MFGRIIITAAVVAGVVHVFRRDLRRIVGALQKPTATFLADVKRELDSANKPTEGVDKASIAAGAADDAKAHLAASKGESGVSPSESGQADKVNEGDTAKMR